MILTIKNILELENGIEKIAFDNNIKGKYSIKLLRNLEILKKETENVDKVRTQILKKYCDKNDGGEPIIEDNNYVFTNDNNKEKAFEELNELFLEEVDVNLEKIDMAALDEANVSVALLSQLKTILNMEE